MPDATPAQKRHRRLRACTLLALRHLHYGRGWTKARIGRAIGYADGSMVGRVMRLPEHPRYVALFGTAETFALAGIAAREGFPLLADEALPEGMLAAMIPEEITAEGVEVDGDYGPELLAVQEHAGCLSASDCETERSTLATRLHAVCAILLRETRQALGPDLPGPAGDSLPAPAAPTLSS